MKEGIGFYAGIVSVLGLGFCTAGVAAEVHFERLEYTMPERCDKAVAADIDGDGDLDLVGICRTRLMGVQMPEGTVHELFNTGHGAMIHGTALDRDGDGDRDVAVVRFVNPWLRDQAALEDPATLGPNFSVGWFENPGSLEKLPWTLHVVDDQVHGVHGIAQGDLDGDGLPDLVSANVSGPHFPKSVTWWPAADGERKFVMAENAGGRPHYVAVGDLNGDDRADVALGTGGGWSVHLQQDEGQWERQELGSAGGGTNVALADLDGDGDLDVIGSAGHGTGVRWFVNPGWEEKMIDAELADVHSLSAGDLNDDGAPDIVANSNKSNVTKVYWNNGGGQFMAQTIDEGHNQQSYGCDIVDLDEDGKLDIILGGRGSNNVVWYRQEG
jgi:hypothetical protein